MSDNCEREHRPLPTDDGFPDLIIGTGDTEQKAKDDAIRKAKIATTEFCAKKKCEAGMECIWSTIERQFGVGYELSDASVTVMLNIHMIECKCKKSG